jgi:hypothetical protein
MIWLGLRIRGTGGERMTTAVNCSAEEPKKYGKAQTIEMLTMIFTTENWELGAPAGNMRELNVNRCGPSSCAAVW